MIEHIDYHDAAHMMRECRRVLRSGGIVRLVTPDLSFLETLLVEPLPPRLQAYVEFMHAEHRIDAPEPGGVHVFNHFMRAWGHRFIYDAATLSSLLTDAGFTAITRRELNESAHEPLRGLARTNRMPPGFLAMESITVEATKG
jgi:predicted SAM-dependent methyltransferase